jgi:hypothetical protein
MRRLSLPLAALLVCAIWPAPAIAEKGSGLYEPFSGRASDSQAKRFVKQLPRGKATLPPGPGAASDRGEPRGVPGSSIGLVLELALALLVLGAPPMLVRRA